ncbi:MAG TPA: LysR family transcriptional regulator [Mycobacterium sp.]|nr:LysR family transcriptional regulator [Mycobacterium sp.]
MLFRQLEYFVAVAREGHFARAAEACYVSQPALSASIAKLERELGVTLINRGHNFEGLTAEGERLVLWARRILAEKDGFKAELAAVQSGITGTLRLGVEPTASTTLALPVAAFCANHPLAGVEVKSRLSEAELQRRLRDFELDAAIAQFDAEYEPGLHVAPLYEEQYVVVAPDDRLIPGNRLLKCADAAQLPLALLSPGMRIRRVLDKAAADCGMELMPRVETDSVASLYALVGAGNCATIVPHTWLHALPVVGTTRIARLTEPDVRAQISVAINATTPGSVVARAFVAAAKGLALNELFAHPLSPPAGGQQPPLID